MTLRSVLLRASVLSVALLLLTPALTTTASPAPAPGELLVGLKSPAALAAIEDSGGKVTRTLVDGKVALVRAADAALTAERLGRSPHVAFVTPDHAVHLSTAASASWWDASKYDASGWDSTNGDASWWDASWWDASWWDAAQWDASWWDASRFDASWWDASWWDASWWDASWWDASWWDASWWDGNYSGRDPGIEEQWGLVAVRAPAAWNTTRGDDLRTVCVLDTGVDYHHPDLQPALWRAADGSYGYNAMNASGYPVDDHGHGTHVAGIVAARGSGSGVVGVAEAKVMAVKVMNASGGTESDLIAGLDYCRQNGAHVASMSLHVTELAPALETAIQAAQSAGMLVVASAGNQGSAGVQYPAAYDGVLAVGAVDWNGTVANFSSTGSALDLVAPGVRIASTMIESGYAVATGTSQAAPFVAGAAALVWSARTNMTAAEVSAALTGTARDIGTSGWDSTSGHGIVDAGSAVASAVG